MKLDEQRAMLASGDGVVARMPGIVLVAVPATGNEARIGELIALCREVGEAAPEAPGRTLARRLAGVLSAADPDSGLSMCVLSQTEDGLSVMLAGDIDLVASSSRGEVKLSGRDAATWVDRILEETLGSCSVSAGGADPPKRTAMYELQGGVVPGVGITLVGGGHVAAMPSVAASAPAPAEEQSAAPAVAAAAGAAVGAAAGVSSGASALADLAEPLPAAEPEPLAPEPLAAAVAAAPEPPPAPAEAFAAPAAAAAAAAVPDGPSAAPGGKSIGVIVFEDGTSYALDKDYIIGREPENDAAVVAGRAGPLVVDDAERSISRVHAELRLFGSELQIVDRGSTNGTYVWSDTNADWVRLVPNQVASVKPGGWVAVGSRSFVFEAEGAG
ncbi:MAG TPA: FHA domain-containing protein [Acidimicrobiales bacterium]|nr:FHA domain-containing protein [Acidimicrobiales bacterium]